MIAYLRGQLLEKELEYVIVDVHGVGYRASVSATTHGALPAVGATVTLRIHTHVREDALALYGFATSEEEELFHLLTSVSGIGPKLGLAILSGMPPQELATAVVRGEIARLTKIGGVGKKTAERLVLELTDKLKGTRLIAKPSMVSAGKQPNDDLMSALQNLGYRPADAERAASIARAQIPDGDMPQLIRAALQAMTAKP